MPMDESNNLALPTTEETVAGATAAEATKRWTPPAFKLSGLFTSHMVLQREETIRVWGFSDTPGSRIAGCFMEETVTATVGEDFRFTLAFSPRPYTREGQILVVSDDRGHIVALEDILVGDVYLIGGQSNAEMHLAPCMELTPSVEFDENDNFRLFAQTQSYVYEHQEFCSAPQPDIINPAWTWKRPDREASLEFSAMGWYFARELQKQIDIPVGLVMMAAGGACLSELLPVELAHEQGYFSGANVPEAGYYNTLIHPVEGLAFRAQLFFQGESEGIWRDRAEKYHYELTMLITDERARFGKQFPFYNVQLSDYRTEGEQFFPFLDIVRNRQFDALALIPDSTLTVDMDLGALDDAPDWAHSTRKLELGERLALLVLAKEYGIGRVADAQSPRPYAATLNGDRTQVIVEFSDVGAGLIVSGHNPADSCTMEVQGFSLGDYDHKTPVHAVLTTRYSVMVEIPEGFDSANLTHVNYAFSAYVTPETADLRGGNNLPVPAFSIKILGA